MLQLNTDGKIIHVNPTGYNPHVSVRVIKKKELE